MGSESYKELDYRAGFVRKVTSIVAFQLAISAVCCIYAMQEKQFALLLSQFGIQIIAGILCIIFYLILRCSELRNRVPYNYFLLIGFTLCQSVLPSVLCSIADTESVSLAFIITAGIVVTLTLFCLNNSISVSLMYKLIVLLIALPFISLFVAIFVRGAEGIIIISALSAAVFGIYFIIDLQRILGKTGSRGDYTYDDYIIASLEIYVDIIKIFIHILRIFIASKLNEKKKK